VVRESAAAEPSSGAALQNGAPVWFDGIVLVSAAGLVSFGLVALALAGLGWYSLPLVLLLGLLAWGAIATVLVRWMRADTQQPAGRAQRWGAGAALFLVAAGLFWFTFQPSQHLLVDRDPGVYVTTAIWISNEGSLVDSTVSEAFQGTEGLDFSSPGAYFVDGRLEFQFNHFTSAAGAVAFGIGGQRALFRVTGLVAALGILAAYSVAVRLTLRPLLSLLVPIVIGVSLPLLVLARDMYSEPYLLLVLWSMVLLLDRLWMRSDRSAALVAGLFAGALLAIRVESVLYLTALAALVAFVARRGRPDLRSLLPVFVLGAVPGVVLGLIDFLGFTGGYSEIAGAEVRLAAVLFIAVAILAPLALWAWGHLPKLSDALTQRRSFFGWVFAALTATLLFFMWLVRPRLDPDRVSTQRWGLMGPIQISEGDAVDLFRTYYEHSVNWIAWYVGPALVVLSILGLAVMIRQLVMGKLGVAGILVLAMFWTGGIAYLLKPGITPDQLWATRRLVPVVLVVFIFASVVMVGLILDALEGRAGLQRLVGGIAAVVLLVPAVLTTSPIALLTEQPTMFGVVDSSCEIIGDQAAVLVVGTLASDTLPLALRSMCRVPVAELKTTDPARAVVNVRKLRDRLALAGTTLAIVSLDNADLERFAELSGEQVRQTVTASNSREYRHTLSSAPDRYLSGDETFFLPREIAISVLLVR
jgi:hypothetical protein